MRPDIRVEGPKELLIESIKNNWQDRWGSHENESKYYYTVNRGYRRQTAAVKSDHFHPTNYYVEVVKTRGESPFGYVEQDWAGDEWRGTRTVTQYISNRITYVAYWYPSDRYNVALDNARSKCRTQALNKLPGKDQMQLGASLAEARTTADMLAGSASTLWSSLLAARRGNWGAVPGILGMNRRDVLSGRFAANNWLAYQYGWRPLVSDIHGAYNKLTSDVQKPMYIFSKHYERAEKDLEYVSNGFRVRQKDKGGWIVKLCAKLNNPELANLNSWGLTNPLSVAWEVVPFSFVIDWGIPVGNVLNALTATQGLDFVWGYDSYKTDSTFKLQWDAKPNGKYFAITSRGELFWDRAEFQRTPMRSFPLPELYGEESPFNTTRVANALALARQLFTGR